MRRVVLVLADGLRPDAITPTDMPSLDALSRSYTTALRASTVRPSRTVAALASLATGVAPKTHGLIEPGLGFLARLPTLRPLARELTRGGVSSQVSLLDIPPTLLWWFGLEIPVCYEGRVLTQAFTRTVHPLEATV